MNWQFMATGTRHTSNCFCHTAFMVGSVESPSVSVKAKDQEGAEAILLY